MAGNGEVTGVARVIVDPADIDTFVAGEILIARMTDPTWYPLFPRARGIVTEIGGWLSHAAIVAREFDLPAIVGVEGACRAIRSGEIVTLRADGQVIRQIQKRVEAVAHAKGSANVSSSGSNVHRLDEHRRFRFLSSLERRAMKGELDDRRHALRVDANGNPEADRRALNRHANLSVYRRKAS